MPPGNRILRLVWPGFLGSNCTYAKLYELYLNDFEKDAKDDLDGLRCLEATEEAERKQRRVL